jgi:uncharacterized protein YoxC
MWDLIRSRQNFVSVTFLLYLLPILIICSFSTLFSFWISPWSTFSVGLILSVCGSLVFFSMLLQLEGKEEEEPQLQEKIQEEEPSNFEEEEPPKSEEVEFLYEEVGGLEQTVQQLQKELMNANERNDELLKEQDAATKNIEGVQAEKDHYFEEVERLDREFELFKVSSEAAIDSERGLYQESLNTISTLRATVDVKQRKSEKLDQKIKDLTYEIKTLLQIADMCTSIGNETQEQDSGGCTLNETAHDYQVFVENEEEDHGQVHHPDDAKMQLKRCIDIAQKITGSQHFATHKSRFGDLALDNYALDLRRLCDNLRSENSSTVFVYSPKDKKLLFINNQVRDFLGWTPDKFVQDFDHIVQEGMFEWNNSILQLSSFNQSQTRFVMRAKSGKDVLVHCQLGLIPTGVFRSNVIGVLYSA